MHDPGEDGDAAGYTAAPPSSPAPSARVRLEAELLATELSAERAPLAAPAASAAEPCLVLVVAADSDLRSYVRECLREHPHLRVRDAASEREAIACGAVDPPDLLIVDAPEAGVVASLAPARAIVLAEEWPAAAARAEARSLLLAPPFSARVLVAAVAGLLAR